MRTRQLMVWTAVLLAAGCSKKSGETDQAGSDLRTPPVRVVERRPYVINEAGIRFDPPASWDLARIDVVSRSGEEAAALQPGADFSVTFDYKAEQPSHRNSPLLQLYVMRRAAWASVENESPAAVIDSSGDWVVVAHLVEEVPYREGLLDADQFAAMRLALDEVQDALSIENGGPADATLRAESKRN